MTTTAFIYGMEKSDIHIYSTPFEILIFNNINEHIIKSRMVVNTPTTIHKKEFLKKEIEFVCLIEFCLLCQFMIDCYVEI